MATESERYFIEKVGLYFEQLGFPRMSGRIFAWLLLSEFPPGVDCRVNGTSPGE